MNKSLTNEELDRYLGGNHDIVLYSQLKNYNSIDDLLPETNTYKVILIEEKKNNGHWVCCCRLKDGYYYFNSYGNKYDSDLFVIPKMTRIILGESIQEFKRLLNGKLMDWNKIKYQGSNSTTCGRYVVVFIMYVIKLGFTPKDVEELFKHKREEYGSYDEMILAMT